MTEVRISQHLAPAGYVSGAFGKWHMGLTPEYNPVNVGFDEFYGFMKRGAHSYFNLNDPKRFVPIQDFKVGGGKATARGRSAATIAVTFELTAVRSDLEPEEES